MSGVVWMMVSMDFHLYSIDSQGGEIIPDARKLAQRRKTSFKDWRYDSIITNSQADGNHAFQNRVASWHFVSAAKITHVIALQSLQIPNVSARDQCYRTYIRNRDIDICCNK